MAVRTSSRCVVGGCTSCAESAYATTPMRTLRGSRAAKALAAACDALMRLGATSGACMLPDTSIARMIVCCCAGKVSVAVGRAAATISTASDTSSNAGPACRRQPGERDTVLAARKRAGTPAARRRPRRNRTTYPAASSGRSTADHNNSGHRNIIVAP